jgi:hypothetical protein
MAEKAKEERTIYDGVGCPADKKSEKTIFRPAQQGDIPVVRDDGTVEKQRVIPPHSANHDKVTPGGIPIREPGDTPCDQSGKIMGPVIRRDPPKTGPHPEKKEEKKSSDSGYKFF